MTARLTVSAMMATKVRGMKHASILLAGTERAAHPPALVACIVSVRTG